MPGGVVSCSADCAAGVDVPRLAAARGVCTGESAGGGRADVQTVCTPEMFTALVRDIWDSPLLLLLQSVSLSLNFRRPRLSPSCVPNFSPSCWFYSVFTGSASKSLAGRAVSMILVP